METRQPATKRMHFAPCPVANATWSKGFKQWRIDQRTFVWGGKKKRKKGAGGGLAAGQGQPTTVLLSWGHGTESVLAYVVICKQGLAKELLCPRCLGNLLRWNLRTEFRFPESSPGSVARWPSPTAHRFNRLLKSRWNTNEGNIMAPTGCRLNSVGLASEITHIQSFFNYIDSKSCMNASKPVISSVN